MPTPGFARTLRARFGLRAFVLSLAVIETVAISTGLYWRSHLIDSVAEGLTVHVESIASELDLGLADALGSRTGEGVFVLPAPETGVQILSSEGTVLAASRRLVGRPALVPMTAVSTISDVTEPTRLTDELFGDAMVVTSTVDVGTRSYVIEAIAALEEVDRTSLIMCVGVPAAGLLVAALIGWGVSVSVGSALRPVRRLAQRAAEVADEARPTPLGVTAHTAELNDLTTRLDHLLGAIRISFEREQAFLDDASHELVTPIAVALAELDLALRSNPDPSTTAALISAREELRRLDRVAGDLLILARERSTGLEMIEQLDLGEVARRAAELVRRDPNQRPVRIQVAGAGTVAGDPYALERVFTNIIANAARHCTLSVDVQIGADSSYTWATIADDGPGIPDHLLANLFDRFTRLPDRQAHSTGLGTAIAAEIIAKHGGTIEAHNRPSGGAHITIRLPRRDLGSSSADETGSGQPARPNVQDP